MPALQIRHGDKFNPQNYALHISPYLSPQKQTLALLDQQMNIADVIAAVFQVHTAALTSLNGKTQA
ncbi:hypothetical protein HBI56_048910 [Parastagonospora nodorum]|uniref:Uncharacterized protein n=2 Tax=Phaeosphaeria nodorum (strain SN15 / ATCC MYA-4574 / FGSC 10173) TaxID=321614 RepID=A0A7U2HVA7_PHANO|nr:hypothetical protein SNOG_02176 [Parastagonospora nodorum SN15]KAH3916684.1 hypothetical protein HBH56_061830 [Parastagonospora nodorum]EAT90388.1 hypothetical protein SNOG_02176 [Parastagonospora nodorum SN15]KAH3930656.1 hypothetical protein HBH54_105770 [Parastagonospora nodorum]KAH3977148.1 hypothetical protein HBH52_114870 [Parastagonospora nodorum]KAH4140804.1 hypothetical protein HBH45_075950 [Parastagonospora nodorum]